MLPVPPLVLDWGWLCNQTMEKDKRFLNRNHKSRVVLPDQNRSHSFCGKQSVTWWKSQWQHRIDGVALEEDNGFGGPV